MGRVEVQGLKLWADLQADQVRLLEVSNGCWGVMAVWCARCIGHWVY